MEQKVRKIFITLTALVVSVFLFVSCTKSGNLGGASSSNGSFSGSINGSVNGGLTGVANATVTLMIAGSSSPLATTTTASDGSFNLTFTNPGGNSLLYLVSNGGNAGGGTNTNNQFLAIAGTTAAPMSSQHINELTTSATELVTFNFGILNDSGGAISLNAPANTSGISNVVAQYNGLIVGGSLNTSNSNLSGTTQTGLKVMANMFASCIESPSKCSTLFSTALSSTSASALSLLESGVNALRNSANNASSLYAIAFPLNSSTGFSLTTSSFPNNFSFNNSLPITVVTFSGLGVTPNGLGIDSQGDAWIGGDGSNKVVEVSPSGVILGSFSTGGNTFSVTFDANGNAWVANASGSNNVAEVSSSGSLIANYTTGGPSYGIAIDPSGNLWVPNRTAGTVTKLSSSGTVLGTSTVGGNPVGVAIDGSGNVWVTNEGSNNVTVLNSAGSPLTTVGLGGHSDDIEIDPNGNAWIAVGGTLKEVNLSGTTLNSVSGISGDGIAIDQSGNVFSVPYSSIVTQVNSSGVTLATYTTSGNVTGMGIDASGNIWTGNQTTNSASRITGVANGPQFFPYSGPTFPTGSF